VAVAHSPSSLHRPARPRMFASSNELPRTRLLFSRVMSSVALNLRAHYPEVDYKKLMRDSAGLLPLGGWGNFEGSNCLPPDNNPPSLAESTAVTQRLFPADIPDATLSY
jgi:hypothetical protein